MSKPTVFFESRHESGNIYALLGRVDSALNDKAKFDEIWKRVQQGNYDQAIEVIKEYVELIDADGLY